MKVIFLDIDGVMNSEIFYRERHKTLRFRLRRMKYRFISKLKYVKNGFKYVHKPLSNYKSNKNFGTYEYLIKRLTEDTCKKKWLWLSEFCNKNDYKICISSVWKNQPRNPEDWERALVHFGFNPGTYVGITPNHGSCRGDEIKTWIERTEEKGTPIEYYAILDDDSDMLPEQMKYFHHCDPYYGLSPNHLYRIEYRRTNPKKKYRRNKK